MEWTSADDFTWSGQLVGANGYAIFQKSPEDGLSGFFEVEGAKFELRSFNQNYQILIKKDETPTAGSNPCGFTGSALSTDVPTECGFSNCPALVSVLILTSPQAYAWMQPRYGIKWRKFLNLGGAQLNQCLMNSGIVNKSVRFVVPDAVFQMNYDPTSALKTLSNLTLLTDSLRSVYGVDFVCLVAGEYDQYGFEGLPYPNKACLVSPTVFLDRYEFVHQIGHLFGGEHNTEDNIGDVPFDGKCNHDWAIFDEEFMEPNIYLTAMAVNNFLPAPFFKETKILHYSNPDIYFGFTPTGRNTANNAAYFSKTMCVVQNNNISKELETKIYRVGDKCSRDYALSIVTPPKPFAGQPPYQIDWYWSPNGLFTPTLPIDDPPTYQVFLNSGQFLHISEDIEDCKFWIMAVLTSADGVVVRKQVKLDFTPCNPNCIPPIIGQPPAAFAQKTTPLTISVFPNPTDGKTVDFQIKGLPNETVDCDISVMDVFGKKLINKKTTSSATESYLNLDFPSDIRNGIYFFKVTYLGKDFVQKIIVSTN